MTFVISKLFTYFLLPPGVFILLLLIISISLSHILKLLKNFKGYSIYNKLNKHIKLIRLFSIISIFTIYLLSIEPTKDFLLLPLENSYPPLNFNTIKNADIIIVLGGGSYDRSPDEHFHASVKPDPFKRLIYAYYIHKTTNLPILVSGGRVFKSERIESEANAMKRVLIKLGVSEFMIFTDTKSKNTYENAFFCKKIMSKLKIKNAILVTSAYHMKRAVLSFKKVNVKVIPAPTDYKTDRTGYNFDSFMPKMSYLYDTWCALHEYIGLIYYSFKY
ncbi:YdcF family protein [Deferribacter autotrophicus]|uniref:YdcF family protein n=1 Tax=Deferribacter autotrophicus TaxID=500465 RepID=A0A5A8F0I0_9BACT|nr:YdcF family protein [Deferribacter autotrophicus]KAA0257368.1 YdcF family protein [Deferribacter autotrophicus]